MPTGARLQAIVEMATPDPGMDRPVILLVDDEPSILLMLSMLLEEEGYRVVTADQGHAALQRLSEERPDLIITDHMMPHLTGLELIERVRAQPGWADLPILLMSAALPAHINPNDLPVSFLQKPASFDELDRLIRKLLGNRA